MPRNTHLNFRDREVDELRRRVDLLGHLLRTQRRDSPVQGTANLAIGIPVGIHQWHLVLGFVAGLWCGCIVSLLALCIGLKLGHSL